MYVEVKSANGISIEPIETSLLAKRIIILDKNIDAQTALEVIKQLIVLGKEKDEPIKMLIHSVGGEIDAGMMIIDAMKSLNVHTYCLGTAYSMAAIIFTAGQVGHRYMLNNSKLMLHEPRIMDNAGGTGKHYFHQSTHSNYHQSNSCTSSEKACYSSLPFPHSLY